VDCEGTGTLNTADFKGMGRAMGCKTTSAGAIRHNPPTSVDGDKEEGMTCRSMSKGGHTQKQSLRFEFTRHSKKVMTGGAENHEVTYSGANSAGVGCGWKRRG